MPESTHHGEKPLRVLQVVTELLGIRIGLSHFASGKALHGDE
jgi:hypothetical protein